MVEKLCVEYKKYQRMPIFFNPPYKLRGKKVGYTQYSCVARQLIFNKVEDFYSYFIKMQMLNTFL